ncbi:MAG: ATP-dependent DNA ligase [Candidatus Bathyarchaeota archaeon]|nr:ATP-dependent DNA ligase [Candidatus Bathyarchaeota archaeon]
MEATTKRKEKTRLLAGFLGVLEPDEVAPAVLLIVGQVFPEFDPRTLEVGWRTMRRVLEGGRQTTLFEEPLTIGRVHGILARIAEASGPGSRRVKGGLLEGLISRADTSEVEVLVRIIFGEMRIGVNEGMMLEGIAGAVGGEVGLVRRALMLTGDLGEVARIALELGEEGLKGVGMRMFVPLKPMLASMSYDIGEVIEEHGGETAFEFKFDGARIQIHRRCDQIRIFSRRLSDVTESLPDIVDLVQKRVESEDVVLEGEAVAIGGGGRPLPFQDLMRRFRRVHDVAEMAEKIPLRLHIFDVLYLGGRLLIDESYEERWRLLRRVCPEELLAERIITGDAGEAEAFLNRAMEAGHEGLMAKRLNSEYTPGSRGKRWFKIKPAETLDLVIAAADWGYGRRTGWLSNYHLAAREGGEYLVIGKTFKGLTDEEFRWMTEKLQSLKARETPGTVHVRPELVVEVAFNEIQRSPHYRSGFALRFARVTRIREDKGPDDADTLERVRELYEKQFRYKDRVELG